VEARQSRPLAYRSVTSACLANFPVRILFLVKSRKTAFGLIAWFTSFRSPCASGWQRSRIEYEYEHDDDNEHDKASIAEHAPIAMKSPFSRSVLVLVVVIVLDFL
jgi:hypothetical protein